MEMGNSARMGFMESTTMSHLYELDYYPEMEQLIHQHWKRNQPVGYVWHLLMCAIILPLAIISLSGNAAVAYIFTQTRGLRNPSNALIVNLAVSDFAMMISNCPMYLINSLNGKWIFGVQACRFYGFCGALFGTVSILTMAAIAVDRYLVICRPFMIMKSAMTRERAKVAIIFVWLYSLVWAIIPLAGISNYVLEGFLTTCSYDYLDVSYESRAFIFAMFVGVYVVPLFIIICCYVFIIWEVHVHAKKFKKAANKLKAGANKSNEDHSKQKKEVKTAKIAAIIIACWVIAWTPYSVVSLIGIATDATLLTPLASQLPAVFAKTAAVYNPIVYAISHPKYREALRNKFPFLICIPASDEGKSGGGTSAASATRTPRSARSNLQQQISTVSQADSVDSEISDVGNEESTADSVATPQAKKRSSMKNRLATQTASAESPHSSIRINSESQRKTATLTGAEVPTGSGTVMQEVVARYSKARLPEISFSQEQVIFRAPDATPQFIPPTSVTKGSVFTDTNNLLESEELKITTV